VVRRGLLAFVLGVVLVAAGAALPEPGGPYIYPGSLGFAHWDCRNLGPHSFVSSRLVILDPKMAEAVAAHELDHEDYMLSVAETCDEWLVVQTTELRLDMEVRAYCTAAIVGKANGRFFTVKEGIWFFSEWLRKYPVAEGRTREEVNELILDRCAAHVGS
jgi:hypothetical protein